MSIKCKRYLVTVAIYASVEGKRAGEYSIRKKGPEGTNDTISLITAALW